MHNPTKTLIDALNNPDGRDLVDDIEDMLNSHNGAERYATEIAYCIDLLDSLTGYRYTI